MPDGTYTETHHIVPRCLGGTDEADNLVELTAEEHLCAHLLLTRIYEYEGLMLAVRHMLLPTSCYNTGRTSFNKKYGYFRRTLNEHLKQMKWWHNGTKNIRSKNYPGAGWEQGMANDPWNKGKVLGPNTKAADAKRGRPQPLKTDEARAKSGHKGTQWWTDGTHNKRASKQPAPNWAPGATVTSSGSTGMKWFNDGTNNKMAFECPVGWTKGRLKKS